MKTYILLLPLLLLGQSNLWFCETKVELLYGQQKIHTPLIENNIAVTGLDDSQQAILQEAYGVLGLTFIGKKTFIEYVQNWIEDFETILNNDDDNSIILSIKDVHRTLGGRFQNPDFPISKLIWRAFDQELKSMGKETSPQGLRDALLKGLDAFSAKMNNKSKLSDHFKERDNKGEYKAISTEDLNKQIMSAQEFEQWLLSFSNTAAEKAATEKPYLAEKEFNIAYWEWFKNAKT